MKNATLSATKFVFQGLILGAALAAGALIASAWTGPGSTPPGGNVDAPINAGSASQVKSGALQVNGFLNSGSGINSGYMSVNKGTSASYPLDVNGTINGSQYCISGGNCITSWPSGGGGGGTITGVTAGSGLSGGGTSGNVTLNNTDTLDTVLSRGSSTSRQPSFSGGVSSNQYCLNGNCITTWPTGSGATPTLQQVTAAGNTTSNQTYFTNSITLGSGNVIYGQGRLHINPSGDLYLLPSGQTYVGKEWGGTGNLTVEGSLCLGGVCYSSWPGGGTPNIDSVLGAGNSSTKTVSLNSYYFSTGAPSAVHIGENYGIQLSGDSSHPVQIVGTSLCLNGSCISSWPGSGSGFPSGAWCGRGHTGGGGGYTSSSGPDMNCQGQNPASGCPTGFTQDNFAVNTRSGAPDEYYYTCIAN